MSIIYIDTGIRSTISSFADDTRVFGKISEADDQQVLQEDLKRVYERAEVNNMALPMTNLKCCSTKLAGNHQHKDCTSHRTVLR